MEYGAMKKCGLPCMAKMGIKSYVNKQTKKRKTRCNMNLKNSRDYERQILEKETAEIREGNGRNTECGTDCRTHLRPKITFQQFHKDVSAYICNIILFNTIRV